MFDPIKELSNFVQDTLNTKRPQVRFDLDGRTAYIVFHGWELVLCKEGKWFCLDTSGG